MTLSLTFVDDSITVPVSAGSLNAMVAAINGGAWVAPTMGNSWVNFGGLFQTVGYRIMGDGTVMLRGLMKSGTSSATVFTLPAGSWPTAVEKFVVASGTSIAEVLVYPDGTVKVVGYDTGASNADVSLSGIHFSTL